MNYAKTSILLLFFCRCLIASTLSESLYYQRSVFEKDFKSVDVRYRESGEIDSIFNIGHRFNGDESFIHLVKSFNSLFGIDYKRCELRFEGSFYGAGISIRKYKKFCSGIEVYEEGLNLFLSGDQIFGLKNSMKNSDIDNPEFLISDRVAIERLKRDRSIIYVKEVRPAYYKYKDRLIPIYIIEGYREDNLRLFRYLINASSGRVIFGIPLFMNIKGNVYMDSPEKDKGYVSVDLPDTEGPFLKNAVADVYSNCDSGNNCDSSKRVAMADENGNYLFTPDESSPSDPFAEVMAYYHLNRLYDWFVRSNFEFNPFGVVAIVSFTGIGSEYDDYYQCNGFYVNRRIVLGFCPSSNPYNNSGVNINLSYDADIIMHELMHGFWDEIYKLYPVIDTVGYSGMINGVNEAIADFIPAYITDDFIMARHLGKINNQEGLRDLSLVRKCPDSLRGEPHYDSEILSTALWSASRSVSDRDLFANTLFISLSGLDSSSTYRDFYENLTKFISRTMGEKEAEKLAGPFIQRNVDRCGRFIEVENGFTSEGFLMPAKDLDLDGEVPYEVQFVYNLNKDNNIVNVDITALNYSGSTSTDYVKFYVNYNKPVNFSFESVNSDFVWVKRSQVLTDLKAGKYYVLPAGDGKGYYYFKFRFAYKEPPPVVNSVDPDEVTLNSFVDEMTITGKNFQSGAKIRLPSGITYEDYEVYDSKTIYVYNLRIGGDTQCGYNSVSVINPDGQKGIGKSLLLVLKGNTKCRCDFTLECDDQCSCDPDCSDGGCGCNIIY